MFVKFSVCFLGQYNWTITSWLQSRAVYGADFGDVLLIGLNPTRRIVFFLLLLLFFGVFFLAFLYC